MREECLGSVHCGLPHAVDPRAWPLEATQTGSLAPCFWLGLWPVRIYQEIGGEEESKVKMFIPPACPCGLHPGRKSQFLPVVYCPQLSLWVQVTTSSLYPFKSKARNCQDLDWYRNDGPHMAWPGFLLCQPRGQMKLTCLLLKNPPFMGSSEVPRLLLSDIPSPGQSSELPSSAPHATHDNPHLVLRKGSHLPAPSQLWVRVTLSTPLAQLFSGPTDDSPGRMGLRPPVSFRFLRHQLVHPQLQDTLFQTPFEGPLTKLGLQRRNPKSEAKLIERKQLSPKTNIHPSSPTKSLGSHT